MCSLITKAIWEARNEEESKKKKNRIPLWTTETRDDFSIGARFARRDRGNEKKKEKKEKKRRNTACEICERVNNFRVWFLQLFRSFARSKHARDRDPFYSIIHRRLSFLLLYVYRNF